MFVLFDVVKGSLIGFVFYLLVCNDYLDKWYMVFFEFLKFWIGFVWNEVVLGLMFDIFLLVFGLLFGMFVSMVWDYI